MNQETLVRKSPAAPDGWGWDDVNRDANGDPRFKGWLSGVFLQKGEPVLEQDGNFLLIRQGETSLTGRQYPIYEMMSSCRLVGDDDELHDAVTVLVVHGYQGKREALTIFRGGEYDVLFIQGADDLADWIEDWFKHANRNKVIKRKQERTPKPDQGQLV